MGIYLQELWSHRNETANKIQSKNQGTYNSTLVWMRILLNPESVGFYNVGKMDDSLLRMSATELREHSKKMLVSFYYESMLYYPDDILMLIKEFLNNPSKENMLKTAVAMKKDLWNKETKTSLDTLSIE